MALKQRLDANVLKRYSSTYDTKHEDIAYHSRGIFLESFPVSMLSKLSIDNYVIGHQRPTFCAHVEVKTRAWANMQGASAAKFGIYFGKTKSDPNKRYRFVRRFGETRDEAFNSVKAALLSLVRLGEASKLDFAKIDANPLSQMFKAKILSLYYPNRFLNVCSAEHLELLGEKLGYGAGRSASEYQHLLLEAKILNSITKTWSNPKFMSFLYDTYVRDDRKKSSSVRKPRRKSHRRVNFEEVQDMRGKIGKEAEKFALMWEKQRLEGADLGHLAPMIEDRRDRPGYGYDFFSFTSPKQRRLIEVKSAGKLTGGEGHRFFLSDNEHKVSKSAEHKGEYFFYLVFFGTNGKPEDLLPIRASDLYNLSEMAPASYVVRFKYER